MSRRLQVQHKANSIDMYYELHVSEQSINKKTISPFLVSNSFFSGHRCFHRALVSSGPKSRARECVGSGVGVDVEDDSRLVPPVQARAWDTTAWGDVPAATNLQVQALGIQLSTVVVLSTMKSDDLVTDDVVSGCESGRDDSRAGEVVADELVSDPVSGGDESGLGDLAPAERAGAEVGAFACIHVSDVQKWISYEVVRTVARGDVVDDWAPVAVRPCVPCKLDQVSSVDIGIELASCCTFVAVDISAANLGRLDKTEILVSRIPTSRLWSVVGVVKPDWVRSFGPNTLHIDTCNIAMGRDGIEKPGNRAEDENGGMHCSEEMGCEEENDPLS